ncbi:MAG: YcxB family protein [Gemmatimonadota bacterium]
MDYDRRLTADDMAASYRVHMRPRGRRWGAVVLWLLLFVAALVFFQKAPKMGLSLPRLIVPAIVVFGLVVVVLPAVVRRRLRRMYAGNRALQAHFRTRVDADGFETSTDTDHASRVWTDFSQWKEDDSYFLLYESPYSFRVIPKRVLGTPERVVELREMFPRYLGPAA